MSKLQDMITKALKGDLGAVAKDPQTIAPKGDVFKSGLASDEQNRIAEIAYIAKALGNGKMNDKSKAMLNAKAKAVGLTTGFEAVLPDGFTGTLLRDVQDELNVAKLFPMGNVPGGTAHDLIALHGIQAYLTDEAGDATQSSEGYTTFVKTTKKIMAEVAKSYELVDDSLIDIAAEVRLELVRAIAEGIEIAVINGDIAGTQDAGTAAKSPIKVCNGIRKAALAKGTVDFGNSADQDTVFTKLVEMQLAGNLYLNDNEVAKGNVVLVADNYLYTKFRLFDKFQTLDKAGRLATLFGGSIKEVFGIPVISTTLMPAVNASGVVSATPADNKFSSCVLLNINTFKLFSNGSVIAETDRNISNQTLKWTTSLRFGFSSIYDSTELAPNTIVASYKNAIAGINIPR